jgi:hypothetical protein
MYKYHIMKPNGIFTALRTGAYLLGIALARLLAGRVHVNLQTVNDLPQCPLGGPGSVRQGIAFWQPQQPGRIHRMALAHGGRIGRTLSDAIIPNQNSQRVQPPKKPKIEANRASAD